MPTRFYFPSSGAAPISPTFHASWLVTAEAQRLKMVTSKSGTAMANASCTMASNSEELIRQYVSEPLAAQTITAQTLKTYIRGASGASMDAAIRYAVRVFAPNGSTVRGTLVSFQNLGSDVDDNESPENRGESVTTTEVIAQEGDYLVLDIGGGGNDASTGAFILRVGDSAASDLPEDQTTTSDFNPWMEFANEILILGAPSNRQTVLSNGYGPIVGG